jgi:hypothetical protein
MPHTLEIKWIDRQPNEGGGTRLTVKVNGSEVVEKVFSRERFDEAKRLASDYLQKAEFDNSPSASAINV